MRSALQIKSQCMLALNKLLAKKDHFIARQYQHTQIGSTCADQQLPNHSPVNSLFCIQSASAKDSFVVLAKKPHCIGPIVEDISSRCLIVDTLYVLVNMLGVGHSAL